MFFIELYFIPFDVSDILIFWISLISIGMKVIPILIIKDTVCVFIFNIVNGFNKISNVLISL